ncbi:MAG: bifunctional YncE family protein/alkaline phosphatase family protein [Chitinophagales bacterium]|nr:bifunctional YncE family protein/alkaline phosphatase family protein [Chitinophagales bacterium]
MRRFASLLPLLLSANAALAQPKTLTIVPGQDAYCRIDTTGKSVIPSGRFITPAGQVTRIARAPFGLAVSPDQQQALVLHNNGILTRVQLRPDGPVAQQTPSPEAIVQMAKQQIRFNPTAYLGVVFSADNQTAYLSGGTDGSVAVWDTRSMKKTDSISLNGALAGMKYEDSFTSDLTINPANGQLLVLDRANYRLVKIDPKTRQILASIPVGRIPFGISCTADGKKALVANVGLYEYPLIPGVTPTNKDSMMMQFPYYALPSKEAEEGIRLPDGRFIPGLGSALAEEAMSVWLVDLEKNVVTGKFKTGYQIGEKLEETEIVGGASPNSIAAGSRFAYVSNATNDLISIIDLKKGKISGEIKLKAHPLIDSYRGLMPFGLCLSKDEKTLYVACLGFNAVAVIDTKSKKVKGYIPTGWGTTRVKLHDNDSKLLILSARGYGAGPNGGKGFVAPPQGTYIGDIQLGTFQVVPLPDAAQLARYTQQVLDNTFVQKTLADEGKNPCPPVAGLRKSPIKHIFYITKENRTYDEVLGQLPGANGDATLARFGVGVDIVTPADTVRKVSVMPNHSRIARQWAFSDNFYCDSDASIHGHHWMVGTMPNEYVEANSQADTGFDPFSKAPGRRSPNTTGGIEPEDYNEIGGMWENLARHGVSFFSFGESNEFTGNYEEWNDTIFGAAHPVPWPLPKVLFDRSCRDYAGYNMNIPDQFRVIQFEREFNKRWLSGAEPFPQLIAMQLPDDHGTRPRPEDGYPFQHSYMADNDLALGRILEILSRSPWWDSTLVIITEDDPQGGVDHIDAHRSILMMAGPYVKKGYVSKRHANFGSILRTIYTLLDVPFVNQYDATATLLDDFFTDKPDTSGYMAASHDPRVFNPQLSLKKYQRDFNWRAVEQGLKMDDESEQRVEFYAMSGSTSAAQILNLSKVEEAAIKQHLSSFDVTNRMLIIFTDDTTPAAVIEKIRAGQYDQSGKQTLWYQWNTAAKRFELVGK